MDIIAIIAAAVAGITIGLGINYRGLRSRDRTIANLRGSVGRFDHDGDGKPGGSLKRR